MTHHTRTLGSLLLVAATAMGCSTSEIAGANRPPDLDAATLSSTELGYTPPRVSTEIPHAPLQSMGGAYASTQWVDTPENAKLLQEMFAANVSPETIHTTSIHLQRSTNVVTGCGADRTTSVSHDTWCDYSLENRKDEPYTVSASTVHQYRHTLGALMARTSVSEERKYQPATVDTIVRKDSVLDPAGPTTGTGEGTGSGGTAWTICWDYYELDLTTGEVTFLFSTCPVSPGGQTQSALPVDGATPRATNRSSAISGATQSRMIGVTALLAQVPALPNGAKIMVRRTADHAHPFLILGAPGASDDDWAGGIEVVKAIVRRIGPDGPPAAYVLGRSTGNARPELRSQAATMRMRMQSANRRPVPGFGMQRAVPLALFVER